MRRRSTRRKYRFATDTLNCLGRIAVLVLSNYIAAYFFGRYDLTADKRHSLSDHTTALLQDEDRLKDRLFFKVYLEGDLPADLAKVSHAVKEKLDEFAVYAGDRIQYAFIDPHAEEDADYNLQVQRTLYAAGIAPCDIEIVKAGNASVKTIWPGALIEYKGRTADRIQFFDKKVIFSGEPLQGLVDKAINNLEYELISAVRRVTAEEKKTVAFLQGHGELHPHQTMDIRKGLDRYYKVEDKTIDGQLDALAQCDALIVAKPTRPFSEKDKFVIDQFIMNGGRVLWLVDPLEVARDSLYRTGQTFGITRHHNIEKDLLYTYGVRLSANLIIDEHCAPLYVPGHPLGTVEWYFYPLLEHLSHPITAHTDPVKAEYASTAEIVNASDTAVTKTVLLRSSYNSRPFRSPARINYGILDVVPQFNDGTKGHYPVAVLLEGTFTSAFQNRGIHASFLNSPDYTTRFKSTPNKMLVVADGDIIRNEIIDSAFVDNRWVYKFVPLRADAYGVRTPNGTPQYAYGNSDFILNAIDYMLDDFSLIAVRTKTIALRLLDNRRIAREKKQWQYINTALPLVALTLLVVAQLLWRKRKYAKST